MALFICWAFYLYVYVIRMEPSVLANNLMGEFNITASTFGAIVSMTYLPYVLMQIPCGVIIDKVGSRTMVIVSGVLLTLGAFMFGLADSVTQLKVSRLIIGLASAAGFLCCGKVITDLFPVSKHSMLFGIAMFMGCFGGIVGAAPTACMVTAIGWRYTTYGLAVVGIIIAAIAMLYMRRDTEDDTAEPTDKRSVVEGIKLLVKNPQAWILGLYGALSYLPLGALAELWIVPFAERRFSISTEQAAIAPIFILVGFGLGGLIGAWVAEKINSYKKTIVWFTASTIFLFWVALNNDSIGFYTCLTLLFLGGIGAGTDTVAFAMIHKCVPAGFGGTSSGFLNSVLMSSALIFQPLLGRLLDFSRNGATNSDGTPLYTVDMFRSSFLFFIAALVVSVVAALFVKENPVARSK
jgi:predicted MFS family arabinose efflux permease